MRKLGLVLGAAGQQGEYMCKFLLEKGYMVLGGIRGKQKGNISEVLYRNIEMTDMRTLFSVIEGLGPNEIYNLAAMNDVARSFNEPALTIDANCTGMARVLELVHRLGIDSKIYFAASSEMYGSPCESPQTETTKFNPRSPYGVSKVAAYNLCKVYREKHGVKVYCGIVYNNESPRRPEVFLSRKVCKFVASVVNGNKEKLKLGNLEARRDFGYAKEYVEWTWRIMQHETPDDFILATGITHSVAEFVETAFKYVGIDNWRDYIEVDQSLYRPSEEKLLVGDASKSERLLGFKPKTTFKELISIMMEHELKQYDK